MCKISKYSLPRIKQFCAAGVSLFRSWDCFSLAFSLGLTVLWSWLRGLGSNGAANTPEAVAKRYTSGGIPLKLESVDKYWGIKHELAR